MLFLSLVRGSGANQGAAIFWQLMEVSGLSGGVYTELYRAVHMCCPQYGITGCPHFKGKFIRVE